MARPKNPQKDYADLHKFIQQQIRVIQTPLQLTDEIIQEIHTTNRDPSINKSHRNRKLKEKDLDTLLDNINNKVKRQLLYSFSQQAVKQVLDQIITLRHLEAEKKQRTVKSLERLELEFVGLDLNNYSLDELKQKVIELPEVKPSEKGNNGDVQIARYNESVLKLKAMTDRLNELQEKQQALGRYKDLVNDKLVGDDNSLNENLQKNIPKRSGTSEINTEVSKMKIILNKLLHDIETNPTKKKQILNYLKLTQDELDELLVLQ